LSFIILATEYASASVTASGSPSGIATANRAIPTNKNSSKSWIIIMIVFPPHPTNNVLIMTYLIVRIEKIAIEAYKPKVPMMLAIFSNFNYNGVYSSSPEVISS